MSKGMRAARTFARGVHPPEHKERTAGCAVAKLPLPAEAVVPLSQHIGAPAVAVVTKGQEVARGEVVAQPGGFVSVAMHAPVAGKVMKVDLVQVASGAVVPAVRIKMDPEADQSSAVGEARDVEALPPQEIVEAVQAAGLVGLGGAAFPTHVKMTVPKDKKIDTVIANGCECEPFLTTDYRTMLERQEDLFAGLRLALKATGAKQAIIGIEANKPDAIALLREGLPGDIPVRVEVVKTKYPQGAEKILIKALLNREVPSGGLPSDVSVACFNVATLAQMGDLLPKGQGLIERVVTVTGAGVARPGNYLVALGAPVRHLLEHAGCADTARLVVLGGPMMGPATSSLDVPITKGVSGVTVFTEAEVAARQKKTFPCIKCGQCVQACPLGLNPSLLGALARKEEYGLMAGQHHLNDCFECACCTYVCPSNIPLVHHFRVAKSINRERTAKKK